MSDAGNGGIMTKQLHSLLARFRFREGEVESRTIRTSSVIDGKDIPVYTNAFWTARQRQAHSLHEVSYRACFKPQLPAFFIDRLTSTGETVYDPFSGRGTTVIEAALRGRHVIANDVNPLSAMLSRPRLRVPELSEIDARLQTIRVDRSLRPDFPLSMFYHRSTLAELLSLRRYLLRKERAGTMDDVDRWIRMVATNRLTGHSLGFFSVYTLPPNQALSAASQRKINRQLRQRPEYRDVKAIILKKSRQLIKDATADERKQLRSISRTARFNTGDARRTNRIPGGSVSLTVTSPPFLDVVQYARDNWLRCWFNGIDAEQVAAGITMSHTVEDWSDVMRGVFTELFRITKRNGVVAFEVGEVRNGKVRLEEHVVRLGTEAGFRCEAIMINQQQFTKTANIWGVANNTKGTNSNRIVLFTKS